MKHDIFFSISQTPGVAGDTPTEKEMFDNYFEQLKHADSLGIWSWLDCSSPSIY